MVGFMLSAVYGTLLTPSLVSKWAEDEDGMCKLCLSSVGTIQHILSGCKLALGQGRYRWRHDKVLRQIMVQVEYHCTNRANNPKRRTKNNKEVTFVAEGCKVKPKKNKTVYNDMGLLSDAKDWVVLSDLGKQLKFPGNIAETTLRPDLVIYSSTAKRVIWWELTCPSEERILTAHELKLDRYAELEVQCRTNGWSCYNMAVEVGARGMVGVSLERAARSIGMKGRNLSKLVREVGREAAHCSRWLYWLGSKREWEYREVVME